MNKYTFENNKLISPKGTIIGIFNDMYDVLEFLDACEYDYYVNGVMYNR